MLRSTFCHIPGIGLKTERGIWDSGIGDWYSLIETRNQTTPQIGTSSKKWMKHIDESISHLEVSDSKYFADLLPSNQHWRLFPEFRGTVAYLDIETTGLGAPGDYITTIALYDGNTIHHYIKGKNFDMFKKDIQSYDIIVTYNGKCFDVPFIQHYLKIEMKQVHIDLRYVLKSVGYSGGLKGCEKQLGFARGDLEGLDGYFAVLLWDEYLKGKNRRALDTLLAYNIKDVLSLENLLVTAYNLKLRSTPFYLNHSLQLPDQPKIPFNPDRRTIEKLKRKYSQFAFGY